MTKTLGPIAVLGTGSWGTALAILLANNKESVRLWGHNRLQMSDLVQNRCNQAYLPGIPFPDTLHLYEDLAECLHNVEDILIVVPSHAFRETITSLSPLLSERSRIAWGTKGLDPNSGQLLHTVAEDILGIYHPFAVLGGPSFAKEVALGLPTAITIASPNPDFAKSLATRLQNQCFRTYTSQDIIGVEVCGTLKNILAIAAGAVDGLHLGANALSALITRGLAEMHRLGLALGGQHATFMGLAGVGDLVLSCTDNQSRNRRFGKAIALGKTKDQAIQEIGQVVEGIFNLKSVYQIAQQLNVDMPITEQIYQVIYENLAIELAVKNLFSREPRSE